MLARRGRLVVGIALSLAIVVPIGVLWWKSLVPSSYSVMHMGRPDYGGGPQGAPMGSADGMDGMPGMAGMHAGGVSVADLDTPTDRKADVVVDLVARKQRFRLASGREVDGYTFNGTSPGPTIRVRVGQLLEVHVFNKSVPEGITVHWHGLAVPNAEDGVAGVTQNAIPEGGHYTYRFVANHIGTYWYHTHQVSHELVRKGLFGALVILPPGGGNGVQDVLAVSHTYDGTPTLNGEEGAVHVDAGPGQTVRVRVANTDDLPLEAWASVPFKLTENDGYDVRGPTEVSGQGVDVPAGGRVSLQVQVPTDGSAAEVVVNGTDRTVVVGPPGARPGPAPQPPHDVDMLTYGESVAGHAQDIPGYGGVEAMLGRTGHFDRVFTYDIGRKFGFYRGRPGMQWTVNGKMPQDMPMFVVREGDLVKIHIENHSGTTHPMHIHGHTVLVLDRTGHPSLGSPWWVDTLDVQDGESYDIAFVANNPGIWMDHCHNLQHAAQGLVTHLMYEGVTEPYRVGGRSANEPE